MAMNIKELNYADVRELKSPFKEIALNVYWKWRNTIKKTERMMAGFEWYY